MKKILSYCFLLVASIFTANSAKAQCIHVTECEICEQLPDSLVVSDPVSLFDSLPQPKVNYNVTNLSLIPKIFSGYQKITGVPDLKNRKLGYNLAVTTPIYEVTDSLGNVVEMDENSGIAGEFNNDIDNEELNVPPLYEESESLPTIMKYKTPAWLKDAITTTQTQENLQYSYMIDNPMKIEYAYWDLPLPPVLLEEDRSFLAFLHKQEVPEVDPNDAILPEVIIKKKHWLHKFSTQLQFSQAFVSPNWYQGGNNYLSVLFGFNWNVNLNQVYHPKLLFQSDLSYKLAVTSNPGGNTSLHRYTIAEDNFQYNLNTGLKAAKDWYYSFNLQFKTQLFNNYAQDSHVRTASFLSPGDLNMGLGMSYNHKNKLNTFQFTLTISPLSYNLKTCISDRVDHETYNIPQNKMSKSEIGSNLDYTMEWKITANISYKTRVFMFTDYKYYLCDWQNTFNFDINKFLSTQLFVHLRYDGSTDPTTGWKKFMMREILSFGLSYSFSTKP